MPPRQPALPEGTDHVVRGASAEGPETGSAKEKLVSQVREQVTSLKSQAGTRARSFADDGKARATSLLDDFSEVIDEAAQAVDRKFGEDYGDYAHRASSAVSGLADKVRAKTIDDLIDDTRDFVRKSPGIAIGIAAVAGFMLVRLIKTGLDDVSGSRSAANDGA
jgi:ElaB/YqjD/DUF883 family membrane-anchored ribosome-binding protein